MWEKGTTHSHHQYFSIKLIYIFLKNVGARAGANYNVKETLSFQLSELRPKSMDKAFPLIDYINYTLYNSIISNTPVD